jgi:hypothetical protein
MTTPELPAKASRRELRKTLLRLRLQMHRQELRHETLVMLQPLRKAQHWREELNKSSAPLWVAGGALLLATAGIRTGNWRRWLRIALIAFPLLRRQPARRPPPTAQSNNEAPVQD